MAENQGKGQMGLVERRMQRTRRDLTKAAMTLFQKQGYDATTVEEIAAAAEVSPRTFYRQFPSKADIVIAMPRMGFEELVATLEDWPQGESIVDGLREGLVPAMGDASRADMEFMGTLMAQNPELRARRLEDFRQNEIAVAGALARRLEISADELRVKVASATIVATMRVAVEDWLRTGSAVPVLAHVLAGMDLIAPMLELALAADDPHD
jgi:AcrR family transcriptional regulator